MQRTRQEKLQETQVSGVTAQEKTDIQYDQNHQ
jgi:hypothetical protein